MFQAPVPAGAVTGEGTGTEIGVLSVDNGVEALLGYEGRVEEEFDGDGVPGCSDVVEKPVESPDVVEITGC